MDLKAYRGDTFVYDAVVLQRKTDATQEQLQVPQDITGWKLWWTVKRYHADPDNQAVFQADTTDGSGNCTITTAAAGKLRVKIPALSTADLPDGPTTLVYDIQGKDGGGTVRTVEVGTIVVSPDVTRALA